MKNDKVSDEKNNNLPTLFKMRLKLETRLCLKAEIIFKGEAETAWLYCKVPKFSDARKLCCNLSKIQEKRPNLRVFRQKDANGIANSEDPNQTAPLGAV